MQWPLAWDPKDIEADFAKMRELGYTLVRFDMLWAFFEPKPGEYNEEAFRQLDYLVDLAHKYRIYLNPSLFIGGEVGEAYWDVPWRQGRNPHTDPEMLRLEANHAAELGRRYGSESAILAWDLTDEPPFWITAGLTDAQAIHWARTIAGGIRRHDTRHPIVIGTSGQEVSHGPFRSDNLAKSQAVGVDFFSVHPFTIYKPELYPDAMLSERSTYGAAFEIALSSGAGRPAMVHEMGASTAQYSPERVAQYERASLYSALGAGSVGVDVWCFTDAAPEQHRKLPYLRTPQETEWGMVTWDRKEKPRGREFKKLTQVVAQLDLDGMSLPPADAALVIPAEWSRPLGDVVRTGSEPSSLVPYVSTEDTANGNPANLLATSAKEGSANTWLMGSLLSAFILGRHNGLRADFPREHLLDDAQSWTKHPIVLLPSPLTSTSTPFLSHVHTDFYARAKQFVEEGGFLYASVAADAAVPDMESIFGARLADTNTASEVTIKVVKAYGRSLRVGDTFRLTIPNANARSWGALLEVGQGAPGEVIAVDQDNQPVLVASSRGRGKTLLFGFPIESHLANTASAFDKAQAQLEATKKASFADQLYRAIREVSVVVPTFASDHQAIEITTLGETKDRASGYAVVVNHSAVARKAIVSTALAAPSISLVMETGKTPVALRGETFELEIAAYDGRVLAWSTSPRPDPR